MRPDKDHWAMAIAKDVASRATCLRRAVGCVLTDQQGRILSTGYNGVAKGQAHCNEPFQYAMLAGGYETKYDNACPGAGAPSGSALSQCAAIHAEQNALLQCRNVDNIFSCYSTTAPCAHCAKLLLNTSCWRIFFLEDYPQGGGLEHWRAGRPNGVWAKLLI